MRNSRQEFGPHEQAFGHDGAGGSTGFADPVEQVAIGYAMNQMRSDGDAVPRATLLSRIVYDCIAKNV
jgi:CubicO group peptidase (beta-lactamase class C family)